MVICRGIEPLLSNWKYGDLADSRTDLLTMVGKVRFELTQPMAAVLQTATTLLTSSLTQFIMVIRKGVEPFSLGWKPNDLTDSRTDHLVSFFSGRYLLTYSNFE